MDLWLIGIATWLFILGGATIYAIAVRRFMNAKSHVSPPSGTKPRLSGQVLKSALEKQARDADRRAAERNAALRLERFIEAFARRLMERWAGLTYDEARHHARGCLEAYDMRFPDPSYDWSEAAARELADTYANEEGESHGSNA